MNLPTKRLVVISHVLQGTAPDVLEYLLRRNTGQVLFVGHPLSYEQERSESEWRLYRNGSLVKRQSLRRPRIPGPGQYVLDTFLTLAWVLRTRQKWDAIIALDNLNTAAAIILRKLGLVHRVVFYTIDYVPKRFNNRTLNEIYHLLDRFCVKRSDVVWNVSERIAQGREQLRGLDPGIYNRQMVVPVGVWFDRYPRRGFEEVEKHSLVYSGGLLPHQGVQLVIDAIPMILERMPDVTLYVTGSGPLERSLRERVRSQDIGSHVEFLGYIADHESLERFLCARGVAVAMYSEDLDRWSYYADPTKIKVYLAAGLPVITTRLTHIATELQKRECGIIVPYDKKAFAHAVVDLMLDEEKYRRFRLNAVHFARQFNWNDIFDRALSDQALGL